MDLIVDTNIIISAIIKNGKIREILLKAPFSFFTPAYTFSEIDKYKFLICKKSGLTLEEFSEFLKIIFKYIIILNPISYYKFNNIAKKIISDYKDVPFIASALSLNCAIWTEDKDFSYQKQIKIYNTKQIIELLEK